VSRVKFGKVILCCTKFIRLTLLCLFRHLIWISLQTCNVFFSFLEVLILEQGKANLQDQINLSQNSFRCAHVLAILVTYMYLNVTCICDFKSALFHFCELSYFTSSNNIFFFLWKMNVFIHFNMLFWCLCVEERTYSLNEDNFLWFESVILYASPSSLYHKVNSIVTSLKYIHISTHPVPWHLAWWVCLELMENFLTIKARTKEKYHINGNKVLKFWVQKHNKKKVISLETKKELWNLNLDYIDKTRKNFIHWERTSLQKLYHKVNSFVTSLKYIHISTPAVP
jgi:hypothetical protein